MQIRLIFKPKFWGTNTLLNKWGGLFFLFFVVYCIEILSVLKPVLNDIDWKWSSWKNPLYGHLLPTTIPMPAINSQTKQFKFGILICDAVLMHKIDSLNSKYPSKWIIRNMKILRTTIRLQQINLIIEQNTILNKRNLLWLVIIATVRISQVCILIHTFRKLNLMLTGARKQALRWGKLLFL